MPDPFTITTGVFTILAPFATLPVGKLVRELFCEKKQPISDAQLEQLASLTRAAIELKLNNINYEHLLVYPVHIRCLKDATYQAEDFLDEMSRGSRPEKFQVSKPLSLHIMRDVLERFDSINDSLENLDRLPHPVIFISDDQTEHLRSLWPSFLHLQKCFLLASIYPKSYKFEKDDLIQLWIAQGFIRNDAVINQTLEDIGSHYLRELVEKNIFSNSGDCYQIKDELHELAQNVSLGECLAINEGEATTDFSSRMTVSLHHFSLLRESPSRVQCHVTVHEDLAICEKLVEAKCEGLRTFLLHIEGGGETHEFCFKRLAFFKFLRVLDISCSSITTVTDSICCLKNLRYFNLSKSRIIKLPRTIRKLQRLSILKLNGCDELRDLPYLGELVKLRHLLLDKNHPLDSLPPGIGQLNELETFSCPFVVGLENGENIGELKNMNNLRGSLCISKLQNVRSLKEASEAALGNKQHLQKLKLKWTENEVCNCYVVVLGGLKPHKNLEILKLSGYGGLAFPDWLSNHSFLPNLTKVSLSNCNACQALPAFWRLKSLKSLSLSLSLPLSTSGMDLARTLKIDLGDNGFVSLETLKLKNMPYMTCWVVEQPRTVGLRPFPKLRQLIFKDCPQLVNLEVRRMHDDDVWLPFPDLDRLTFQNCPLLGNLEFLQHLNSQWRLKIRDCPLIEPHPGWQREEEQEDGSIIYCPLIELHPGRHREEEQEDGSIIYSPGGWLKNRFREFLRRWWK